jgi:hypothetical protein
MFRWSGDDQTRSIFEGVTREPPEDSKKLLPLLAVSPVVVMLLGGLVGLVKRKTVPNEVLANQEFLV